MITWAAKLASMRGKSRILTCIFLFPILFCTFMMYRTVEKTCPLDSFTDDYSGFGDRKRKLTSHDAFEDLKNVQDGNALDFEVPSDVQALDYQADKSHRHHMQRIMSSSDRDTMDWRKYHIIRPRYIFNCSNIHEVKIKKKIGHGVSKQTFLGLYKGLHVAVKMVTRHLHDVRNCLDELKRQHQDTSHRKATCYVHPTMKLMKEILLSEQIEHNNMVKLLGYCVRSEESDSTDISEHGVVGIYEFGHRFVVDSLQLLPWQDRLRHATDMARLLQYLEFSPIGSLVVPDFKEGHFLLVNSSIKMIDLDDVNNLEPPCGYSDHVTDRSECDYSLKCREAQCLGFNAKTNLKNMNKLILKRLLFPVSFPENLISPIGQLNAKLDSLAITASELLAALRKLHDVKSYL
ncbi:extracellular tyrosine-protein kinase PKDCC-like [Haliotis rufescens]|uniref:extracellular tyrosine-protein kinase PKDCC-like n=1 Tax=Haliotis rufescens TaxID=6454 RepID=UPI001EAFD1D8|nr:extracellular tyrosine-protein kinase PKDCC-like [Haliotis rufescens]